MMRKNIEVGPTYGGRDSRGAGEEEPIRTDILKGMLKVAFATSWRFSHLSHPVTDRETLLRAIFAQGFTVHL